MQKDLDFSATPQRKRFDHAANKGMYSTVKKGTVSSMQPHANTSEPSIHFDIVVPNMIASNRKQVIRLAAHEIAKVIGIGERILGDRLSDTEKENPFAIGDGIALTHLKLSGLKQSLSMFIRLKNPIAMDAPDNKDVDLVCLLLTPEREGTSYLRTLARVSRVLRNPQICNKLRLAADEKSMRTVLEQSSITMLAA